MRKEGSFSAGRRIVTKPAEFFGTGYDGETRPNPYAFFLAMMGLGFVNAFFFCFAILAGFDDRAYFFAHFTDNIATVFSLEGKTLAAYFVMCVIATGIVMLTSTLLYSGGTTKVPESDIASIVLYLSVYEQIATPLIGLHIFSASLLNPFQRSTLLPRVDTTPEGHISPIVLIANLILFFALFAFLIVRCAALVTAFRAFKALGGTSVRFFLGFAPVYLAGFCLIPGLIYFFAGLAVSGFH